ncbi:hypothetical protein COB64_04070 [Candidatus Wolfebacteria bacterium]|nr:MAG: hypothetical protein COB64_04070 [Candidatus Wolfebacteria bacterium]
MENLLLQSNTYYATRNGEIVYIYKRVDLYFIGRIQGKDKNHREWTKDGKSFDGDIDLDLICVNPKGHIPICDISIGDNGEYNEWKQALYHNSKTRNVKLWVCIHKWGYIMEKKIRAGARVEDIAIESAKEVDGLLKGTRLKKGELAITVLYQSWQYGKNLEKVEDYQEHCYAA